MSTPPFYVDGAGGDRWGDGEQDEVGRKLSFEVFLCFASSSRASSFLKLADASGTRRQSAGGSVRPWASRPSTSMWSIPSLLTTSSSSLIMPLCSLHLLSLSCAPRDFLGQLRGKRNVILASQPHSPPVIRVGEHDGARINGTQWHLLVVLDKDEGALREDEALGGSIKEELVLTTGIPSKLIESYKERRGKLVKDEGPPLVYNVVRSSSSTSSSSSSQTITPSRDSQNLELSNDLVKFAHRLRSEEGGTGPVWMLNLLKFKKGKKEEYIQYGQVSTDDVALSTKSSSLTISRLSSGLRQSRPPVWRNSSPSRVYRLPFFLLLLLLFNQAILGRIRPSALPLHRPLRRHVSRWQPRRVPGYQQTMEAG